MSAACLNRKSNRVSAHLLFEFDCVNFNLGVCECPYTCEDIGSDEKKCAQTECSFSGYFFDILNFNLFFEIINPNC